MLPFSENQKWKRRNSVQKSHTGALFCTNFGFWKYKISKLHCRVYEQSEKFIKQKMTLIKDCIENIHLILILTAKYEKIKCDFLQMKQKKFKSPIIYWRLGDWAICESFWGIRASISTTRGSSSRISFLAFGSFSQTSRMSL